MKRFWAAVAVVVLAAGCSQSPTRTPTALELARRLVKAGLCHDARPDKHSSRTATCQQLAGIVVRFAAFPTHRRLMRAVAQAKDFSCAASGGEMPFEYVGGRTWFVAFPTSTLLTARALGGHVVKSTPCPAPDSVLS